MGLLYFTNYNYSSNVLLVAVVVVFIFSLLAVIVVVVEWLFRDEASFCAVVDGDGEVTDFVRLPHVMKQRNGWNRDHAELKVSTLLTLSPLRLYTLPYWSNPPFLIFGIRALWRSILSATAPECQKLKMVG